MPRYTSPIWATVSERHPQLKTRHAVFTAEGSTRTASVHVSPNSGALLVGVGETGDKKLTWLSAWSNVETAATYVALWLGDVRSVGAVKRAVLRVERSYGRNGV